MLCIIYIFSYRLSYPKTSLKALPRCRISFDLLNCLSHIDIIFKAQPNQINDLLRRKIIAQLALRPKVLDIREIALQDLIQKAQLEPFISELARQGNSVRAVLARLDKKIVEAFDFRNNGGDVLGFVNANVW